MHLLIVLVLLVFTGLFALMSLPMSADDLQAPESKQKHNTH